MKKKKNADVVETEAAEAVTEETKTSKDKKPETETAEDIEKKAEEEAAEIEAYDAEGNPILKKKKKRKRKRRKKVPAGLKRLSTRFPMRFSRMTI